MTSREVFGIVWRRVLAIPAHPGSWGRFLSCVLASAWADALWTPGSKLTEVSGTADVVEFMGLQPAALWMTAVAVVPISAYLLDSIPLRLVGAAMGQTTWLTLLVFMVLRGHAAHLSAGTCVVGVLACVRADLRLLPYAMARRKQ